YPRSYSTSPISGAARYGSGARKTGRPGSGSSGWQTTGSRNRESFIRGQRVASPLDTQGGSRMPELGPYGSVRGARGNSRPYRESDRPTVKTALLTQYTTWTRNGHATTGVSIVKYAFGRRFA